ncbi:expressed protein [Echinococcus multilocularis]|uniref:Expressed protein n=1 Tax=Echinococcus multilocularis TaxID=6211 RepID=A0A068YES3_ECHMU|nr:expressed protein [Echinococcus multilocularis]
MHIYFLNFNHYQSVALLRLVLTNSSSPSPQMFVSSVISICSLPLPLASVFTELVLQQAYGTLIHPGILSFPLPINHLSLFLSFIFIDFGLR